MHRQGTINFIEYVDEICKKLGQRIGVLNKIKRHIPIKERKLYYNAMIKPIMKVLYGVPVHVRTFNECTNHRREQRASSLMLIQRKERNTNYLRK